MSEDSIEMMNSYMPSAYKQGDVGEVITASELRSLGMNVIRNLYFPYKDRFTEVDMIGISAFGIFIVENKNYTGKVVGNINDKYWNVNYSMFNNARLLNPVLQNELHKSVIVPLIKSNFDSIDEKYIFRPVIFNDKCELSIKNSEKDVFTLSRFKNVYSSYAENGKEVISSDYQLKLYDFLCSFSNISDLMRLLHVVLMKGTDI